MEKTGSNEPDDGSTEKAASQSNHNSWSANPWWGISSPMSNPTALPYQPLIRLPLPFPGPGVLHSEISPFPMPSLRIPEQPHPKDESYPTESAPNIQSHYLQQPTLPFWPSQQTQMHMHPIHPLTAPRGLSHLFYTPDDPKDSSYSWIDVYPMPGRKRKEGDDHNGISPKFTREFASQSTAPLIAPTRYNIHQSVDTLNGPPLEISKIRVLSLPTSEKSIPSTNEEHNWPHEKMCSRADTTRFLDGPEVRRHGSSRKDEKSNDERNFKKSQRKSGHNHIPLRNSLPSLDAVQLPRDIETESIPPVNACEPDKEQEGPCLADTSTGNPVVYSEFISKWRVPKVKKVGEQNLSPSPVDKPKKPRERSRDINGFIAYTMENRNRIREENPHDSNHSILKKLGQMWKECGPEEKNRYLKLAKRLSKEPPKG